MNRVISVLAGRDKSGSREAVERFDIERGRIYSIVGFTGSGKTQLISDIEQMAQGDTVTGRRIQIDGQEPDERIRYDTQGRMVAQLSQNMNFTLEMEVAAFLRLHAECRGVDRPGVRAEKIIESANTLAGEPIKADDVLTRLSGGQSRALMIADVAGIADAPIVLIDEVENAGIDRSTAINLLSGSGKTVLIVTHDPQLALLGEERVVMKNGGMEVLVVRTTEEKAAVALLEEMNSRLFTARNIVREGKELMRKDLEINNVHTEEVRV